MHIAPLRELTVPIDGCMSFGCHSLISDIEFRFALRTLLDNPWIETFARNWRYGY